MFPSLSQHTSSGTRISVEVSRDGPDRGSKRHLTWLALLDLGLLMVALVFTPLLNPPQCPDYATRMPDGSHCIIGANIGAGLLWMAGLLLVVTGTVGLVGSLVTVLWGRR